jgi:hypothetical protein
MNKRARRTSEIPFDVTYRITFSGKTYRDGKRTMTAQMIRDKVIYLLEDMINHGYIRDYSISAMLNNIEQAKQVIKRSKSK